jgi:hypothetical protein
MASSPIMNGCFRPVNGISRLDRHLSGIVDGTVFEEFFAMDLQAIIEGRLEPFASYYTGSVLASLIAVKGKPGKAELEGSAPFTGTDGLALDKAFGKLGWGLGSGDTRTWFGVLLAPEGPPELTPGELRLICEIVDPLAIIALDEEARTTLIKAFVSAEEGFLADFTPGGHCEVLGRRLVSVEEFEDSLENEAAKQKAWAQLKQATFGTEMHP